MKHVLLALLALAAAPLSFANSPLVVWDFGKLGDGVENTGNFVESASSNAALIGPIVLARPVANPASGLGTPGQAAIRIWQFNNAHCADLNEAVKENDFISFSIEPRAGQQIVVSEISLLASRGGDTPVRAALLASTSGFRPAAKLGEVLIGSTNPSAPDALRFAGLNVVSRGPVEFRVYFYGASAAHVGVRLGNRSLASAQGLVVHGTAETVR